jgi:hypothetical protein
MRFRCPFEENGRLTGSIIEVVLTGDKTQRLAAIHASYHELHHHLEKMAIRFLMPLSLQGACSSNAELQGAILPYQAELLAVDIDMQLSPFLPYQRVRIGTRYMRRLTKLEPRKALMARALTRLIHQCTHRWLPLNVSELSLWIEAAIGRLRMQHPDSFELAVRAYSDRQGKEIRVLGIEDGAVGYSFEEKRTCDSRRDFTKFGIVKSPFYPEGFGRHSERIEIVVNRNADVKALPPETRRNIRYRANVVHAAYGVKIDDLYETQQPLGLWLPEFEGHI